VNRTARAAPSPAGYKYGPGIVPGPGLIHTPPRSRVHAACFRSLRPFVWDALDAVHRYSADWTAIAAAMGSAESKPSVAGVIADKRVAPAPALNDGSTTMLPATPSPSPYLFPPDWLNGDGKPQDGFLARPLRIDDYDKGTCARCPAVRQVAGS